jgi:hypothetical protein
MADILPLPKEATPGNFTNVELRDALRIEDYKKKSCASQFHK